MDPPCNDDLGRANMFYPAKVSGKILTFSVDQPPTNEKRATKVRNPLKLLFKNGAEGRT